MPDINYRLNVDTTQLANSMSEIRSQLNMGVGSGFGFIDTGRAALGGINDFGGAAAAAGSNIVYGLQNMPMPTMVHMDRAISFTPHYGVLNAQASLQAEWLGRFYGPAGVAPFTPPGVGPTEYHSYLMREHEKKFAEAKTDALIAGGGTLAEFAGGAVGGGVGGLAGKVIGAAIGTVVAPGVGSMVGGFLGGVAGDIGGALLGSKVIGAGVEKVREARQMTNELGSIIDARRNLPLNVQRGLAATAMEVGHDVGMNTNEVADIIARMPQLGTLIPTTDLKEFAAQLRSVITDIRDFSSALHTSTGAAQTMMARMERFGFHGVQGADWLLEQSGRIGMGVSPTEVYSIAMSGAAMTKQAQIGGGFGFRFMPDVAAETTHARLGREGLEMAGGVRGFASAMAQNILGNAFSPMGMLQIAAAPPGFSLPTSLEGTLDAGINNIMGDFPRRVLALQVGRGEAINAEGRGKTIEMAKQNLRNMVDVLSPIFGPNVTEADRELLGRQFLMQQGMDKYQAKGAAYRYLSPNAQDTHGRLVSSALAEARRNRELDHIAYSRSEEMEMHAKHPFLGIIPGAGRLMNWSEGKFRAIGEGAAIREGASVEGHLRDYYHRMGLPYDASSETMDDVEAGVISARGVAAPGRSTAIGRQMAALAGIMGGNGASVSDMMRQLEAYSTALAGYTGNARDLRLSASGLATNRQFRAQLDKDETGFKHRLQGLADAVHGDESKIHGRLLDVFRGTAYEAEIRKTGGLSRHAGEALPLLEAYADAAGVNLELSKVMGTADLKAWVASEYERTHKLATGGDRLKDLSDTIALSGRRKVAHEDAGMTSSEALGGLANLIARQNQVLDGIVQELRRSHHDGKRRHSRATVGAN